MKMRDSFFTSFVAGGIATLVQMAISWSLYLAGIVEQNPSIFHARLLTNKMDPNIFEIILGALNNLAAGMFFALAIFYFLRLTGTDYALLKGGFIGYINAIVHFLFLARLYVKPGLVLPNAITEWHVFAVYTLWGVITAYIIRKYGDVKIIRS
jgi:hypothetical protein